MSFPAFSNSLLSLLILPLPPVSSYPATPSFRSSLRMGKTKKRFKDSLGFVREKWQTRQPLEM
jgi:hypothetical protein